MRSEAEEIEKVALKTGVAHVCPRGENHFAINSGDTMAFSKVLSDAHL